MTDCLAMIDKLTAVKKGSAKVTFTAKDGSKKSAVCKVTVKK